MTKTKSDVYKAAYSVDINGSESAVTIEQAPPKSLIVDGSSSILDTGTATYVCTAPSSAPPQCVTGVGASNDSLSSLAEGLSRQQVITTLRSLQSGADSQASKLEGASFNFYTQSYGGQSSRCLTLQVTNPQSTSEYCVAAESGVLTYSSTGGTVFVLNSFSTSYPASDFNVPSGATIVTEPAG